MSTVDNKELGLLLEAIDNCDLYIPSCCKLLKILIELAVDDVAIVNVTKLVEISNLSRTMVYRALKILQDAEFIEIIKKPGLKAKILVLKPIKLHEIIKYYERQMETKKRIYTILFIPSVV